ncbi:MAG TPA: BadF/BadG/BcrA/BcrD ATPase family protein [Marmoricola sp.]|nr:BadF/BadG/BcrA/BcrD ATPase family protein [Marmoricola sp.]
MTETFNVAIDLGGSGARVSIVGSGRRRSLTGAGWDPEAGAFGHLQALVGAAASTTTSPGPVRLMVAAGLTGLNGVVPPIDDLGELLFKRFGVESLRIADDSLTSALGATAGTAGVVLAIGTGVVALGLGPDGEVARVDGGGAFIGDRGSGWWIGRQGLIAAVSALEHRSGGSDRLLSAAVERYGSITSLPQALREVPNPFREIARFSDDVASAALAGDREAISIFARAGDHLATAAAAAALQTNQRDGVPVYLLGGVSKSSALFAPEMFEALRRLGVDAAAQQPRGDALNGAEALLGEIQLTTDLLSVWSHGRRMAIHDRH